MSASATQGGHNQPTYGEVRGKKVDCLTRSVRLGTVLLTDKELARDLECGKKQLLLAVVGPIAEPEGPLFSAEFFCLSVSVCVCVSLTGTSTLQR